MEQKNVIGVYTDASYTEIDFCILTTDGLDLYGEPIAISRPYPPEVTAALQELKHPTDFSDTQKLTDLENIITDLIIDGIKELMALSERSYPTVDLIGLSGQSVYHNTFYKKTLVLANADKIANTLNIPTVDHFVQSDLNAGGTGGPLLASFYEVLTKNMEKPLVIADLGGISALTYISDIGELMSFHVGPGNLLLDAWIQQRCGQEMDYDGLFGAKGTVDDRVVNALMRHPFLHQAPPKTADRNEFIHLLEHISGLTPEDGAATLTAFIARALGQAEQFLPTKPTQWILTGGGTKNPTLVLNIKKQLPDTLVQSGSVFGWSENTLSAQGYGFLAVRSLFGLPISFPQTTGVVEPACGGLLHIPNTDK